MTDGAASPIAISDLVHAVTRAGLIDVTITAGHAFGGHLEAVSVPSALALARHAGHADATIVAMGPVSSARRRRSAPPHWRWRASWTPPRSRHTDRRAAHVRRRPAPPPGVSHHSRTALDLTRSPVLVAPDEGLFEHDRHDVRVVDGPDVPRLAALDLHVTTMGRGPDQDPLFFRATAPPGASQPTCSRSVGSARVGAEAGAAPQPDRASRSTRRPLPASEIQSQLEYPRTRPRSGGRSSAAEEPARDGHPAARRAGARHPPQVDGYRIPREEYAPRDPGLTTEELAALHLAASAVQVEGLPATEGLLKLGAWSPTGPVTWGSRRPAPGGPQPGAAVRRRGQPESGAPALPRRGAHRGPVPPRVPARPLVPHRLRPPPGGGAELPARPHRRRGGHRGRPGVRPPPRPSPDKPAARGSSAPSRRSAPGCASTDRRRAGRCSTSVPTRGAGGPDGSVVVELPVTNRAAFRSFVLSFLEHAEILDPPEPARRPGGVALVTVSNASAARMQRLLAMVPWIAAQDGPTLVEVCERFGLTEGARR